MEIGSITLHYRDTPFGVRDREPDFPYRYGDFRS